MKRFGLMVILFAAFGLTACQSQTPTAPSGAAGQAPVSGVLHDDDGSGSMSARLTASPSTINAGQSSMLTWTTEQADHVYLDGVEVARSGSKSVSPSATKTYTLVAAEDDHRVSSTATVTVSGGGGGGGSCDDDDDCRSSTVLRGSLTATPTTIQAGQASTLNWTSSNATAVYLDGVSVALNGSKSVSPTATRTYNLVAINGSNRVTSSATVTVSSTTPPPVSMPTASLTTSSTAIQAGQSVTLELGYDQSAKLDLTGVANEKMKFVHVGEKLIIVFDNQSTVTVHPFFDSMGVPLQNITVEVSAGRDLASGEFASTFPIVSTLPLPR